MIEGVSGFVEDLVEFGITVTAAIARRAGFAGNLRCGKQVAVENRILIAADPLTIRHLKLAAA